MEALTFEPHGVPSSEALRSLGAIATARPRPPCATFLHLRISFSFFFGFSFFAASPNHRNMQVPSSLLAILPNVTRIASCQVLRDNEVKIFECVHVSSKKNLTWHFFIYCNRCLFDLKKLVEIYSLQKR